MSPEHPLVSKDGAVVSHISWAVLPLRSKATRIVAACLLLLAVINVFLALFPGVAGSQYFEWKCSHCGATLYYWPAANRRVLTLRQGYATPDHDWILSHPAAWEAWLWLSRLQWWHRHPSVLLSGVRCGGRSTAVGMMSAYLVDEEDVSSAMYGAIRVGAGLDQGWSSEWQLAAETTRGLMPQLTDRLRERVLQRLGALSGQEFESLSEALEFLDSQHPPRDISPDGDRYDAVYEVVS